MGLKLSQLSFGSAKVLCDTFVCTDEDDIKCCPLWDETAEACKITLLYGVDPSYIKSPASYRNEILQHEITINKEG